MHPKRNDEHGTGCWLASLNPVQRDSSSGFDSAGAHAWELLEVFSHKHQMNTVIARQQRHTLK